MMDEQKPIADDLLEGASAIAVFLFGHAARRRRVYDLAAQKKLPIFYVGNTLCGRKSELSAHMSATSQGKAA